RQTRRGHRRLAQLGKHLGDGPAQLGNEYGARLAVSEWRYAVLQLAQLLEVVERQEVGARRQHLPHLDKRRAEFDEPPAQTDRLPPQPRRAIGLVAEPPLRL